MGSGSAVALQASHFTLVGGSHPLLGLVTLVTLSRSTVRKILSNFAWASLYNALLVPLAAGAFYALGRTRLPPVWASLAMALSSISVVLSSLALKVTFRVPEMVRNFGKAT
jgi:cation transport ATPase